jgi:CRP/FNR family cyclic AMP-dependent transcriptional regulator
MITQLKLSSWLKILLHTVKGSFQHFSQGNKHYCHLILLFRRNNQMSDALTKRVLPASEYIFKEGEKGSEAYLIMDGQVEIRLGAFGDNPKVLATLSKGDVIGEMSLVDQRPHMASAMAMNDITVAVLTSDSFKQRLKDMDPVMRGIINVMVQRLRLMGNKAIIKASKSDWSSWQD